MRPSVFAPSKHQRDHWGNGASAAAALGRRFRYRTASSPHASPPRNDDLTALGLGGRARGGLLFHLGRRLALPIALDPVVDAFGRLDIGLHLLTETRQSLVDPPRSHPQAQI